jgi:hypothetical protein
LTHPSVGWTLQLWLRASCSVDFIALFAARAAPGNHGATNRIAIAQLWRRRFLRRLRASALNRPSNLKVGKNQHNPYRKETARNDSHLVVPPGLGTQVTMTLMGSPLLIATHLVGYATVSPVNEFLDGRGSFS